MGKKIDLEKTIEEIKKHGDAMKARERSEVTDTALDRFAENVYIMAHNHIIELIEVLAENGKI